MSDIFLNTNEYKQIQMQIKTLRNTLSWSTDQQFGAHLPIQTLNNWTELSRVVFFFNGVF